MVPLKPRDLVLELPVEPRAAVVLCADLDAAEGPANELVRGRNDHRARPSILAVGEAEDRPGRRETPLPEVGNRDRREPGPPNPVGEICE